MADFVRVEIRDAIGTIRLERPPMNALNRQVQDEIRDAATAVSTDDGVRAVIVYGGEKVFAAGADIKEMADMSYVDMAARAADLSDALGALARIPKPVVAAITGYALGGGCEIALACDWRVVAEDAKLGQPEIKLGIIPGAGGTQRLPRAIAKAKAMDMILTARMMNAEEAERAGLVSRVVPAAELMSTALAAAAEICAFSGPSVMMAKEAINRAWESPLSDGIAYERRLFHALFGTEDKDEGMEAFLAKRKPSFKNR